MASDVTTARIEADTTLAGRLAARGTPHFFVNGIRLRGAQPFERFQTVINEQREIAQALVDAGTPRAGIYDALQEDAVRGPAPMIQPAGNANANARPSAPAEPPAAVEIPVLPTEPSRGPADAAVTVVEYSDFQCPYCSRFANGLDEALEGYEDRVRVVFKQFPLGFHDNAQIAAEASLAAHAQGKFWEMHDLLFANARALGRENLDGLRRADRPEHG